MTHHEPASVIGSLARKDAATKSGSHIPAWVIIAGAIIGILGTIIMAVASTKLKEAKSVEAFTVAMGWPAGSPQIDAATTWGDIGLGVALVGLAVAAIRQ